MPITEQDLSPAGFAALIQSQKQLQLVDVRQPEEYRAGHIHGAKLIPLGTLEARIHELDKKKPLLFYCAAGGRSGQALDFAISLGFNDSGHLAGGIGAWIRQGQPVEI